jgi:dienelactone hydrolase
MSILNIKFRQIISVISTHNLNLTNALYLSIFLSSLLINRAFSQSQNSWNINQSKNTPGQIAAFFSPPPELAEDFGKYRSPLKFYDGTSVKTKQDWQKRRNEILKTWHGITGMWPPLIDKPKIKYLEKSQRENFTQHKVRVEIAPDKQTVDGYLLVPNGKRLCPAMIVVYYDPQTAVGLGKRELRDFAYQLTKRGFVTLSIGTPEFASLKAPYKPLYESPKNEPPLQPLSTLAYVAANCHTALADLPQVDSKRIGIMGHSYGGKWAMFAACLYDKFACTVWSDPGIVFDESRPNVNYWEPWYLGYDPCCQRQRGLITETNPRTGAYKKLYTEGYDLHELHALMAPRPFLVSGGAEDRPKRWKALNHTIEVNKLLKQTNRVAMTNRKTHAPTPKSNEQIYIFLEHFLADQ